MADEDPPVAVAEPQLPTRRPWPDGLPTETELRDCAARLVAEVDLHCCTLGELRAQMANQCGVAVEALGVVTEEVNELIKEVVEAHFAKKSAASVWGRRAWGGGGQAAKSLPRDLR